MAGVDCSIGRLDELFLPSVACTDAVGAGEALLRCEVSSHRSKAKEGFLSSLIFFFFFVVVERCPRMIIARTAISSRWVVDPAVTSSRAVARNLAESRQRFFLFFFDRLASLQRFMGRIGSIVPEFRHPTGRPVRHVETFQFLSSSRPFRISVWLFFVCLRCFVSFRSIDRSIHSKGCLQPQPRRRKQKTDRSKAS